MLHRYDMSVKVGWILFTAFSVRVKGNIQSSVISFSRFDQQMKQNLEPAHLFIGSQGGICCSHPVTLPG